MQPGRFPGAKAPFRIIVTVLCAILISVGILYLARGHLPVDDTLVAVGIGTGVMITALSIAGWLLRK